MKIILKSDVERLGKVGEVVSVAVGYARNYLIPRNLAVEATPRNMEKVELENRQTEKAQRLMRQEAEDLAGKVEQLSLTVSKSAGENDRLFGTVTAMEIAAALESEGCKIDKRKIILDEPIKTLGIYTIPIKLHAEVTAKVKLWVVKE
jgi:large subunit ribosomal protein L9